MSGNQTQRGNGNARWRQARPDDSILGSVFVLSINDPPPSIGVAADALDVGDYVTIEGVTGGISKVVVTDEKVEVAVGDSRLVLAPEARVTLHLEVERR